MRYTPLGQVVSIVVVGNMNPAIFSPAWLRLHNIISDEELNLAKVGVIHPDITDFAVDTLKFEITPGRLIVQTAQIPAVRIADIVSTLFGTLLPETPTSKVGFNVQLQFNLDSQEQRTQLGHALAPVAPWGEWGAKLDPSDKTRQGGLALLSMQETQPDGRRVGGYRRVQIEPVGTNTDALTGVLVAVNDHYELESGRGSVELVTLIRDSFDSSLGQSNKIITDLMDFAASLNR